MPRDTEGETLRGCQRIWRRSTHLHSQHASCLTAALQSCDRPGLPSCWHKIAAGSKRYLGLLLLVTFHVCWLCGYAEYQIRNEPACQASCERDLPAIEQAIPWDLGAHAQQHGPSCLIVAPPGGYFGSCLVTLLNSTIVEAGNGTGRLFAVGLLPSCEYVISVACTCLRARVANEAAACSTLTEIYLCHTCSC
eukprot:COSAG01_NODE_3499_length_6004_cov_2.645047_9_plen_193_part_00